MTAASPAKGARFIRQMNKPGIESGLFGEDFLWVLLARKT